MGERNYKVEFAPDFGSEGHVTMGGKDAQEKKIDEERVLAEKKQRELKELRVRLTEAFKHTTALGRFLGRLGIETQQSKELADIERQRRDAFNALERLEVALRSMDSHFGEKEDDKK